MVTILSYHQQNTMVSTFNVLLLTLNKALPGSHPRITRVSLMVRVKFSLNKFQSSLVLKTSRAIILFPLSRWIQHQLQTQVWGRSRKFINALHIRDLLQSYRTTSTAPSRQGTRQRHQSQSATRWFGWIRTALIPIIFKSDGLCILYLSTLFDSWVWMVSKSCSLKSNSKWINVLHLLYMSPMVGLHMFYFMLIILMLVNKNP